MFLTFLDLFPPKYVGLLARKVAIVSTNPSQKIADLVLKLEAIIDTVTSTKTGLVCLAFLSITSVDFSSNVP